MAESKDQQVRHVVVGVGLGVLAAGVEASTSTKMTLELLFNSVWRSWSPAARFPSIENFRDPGNLFYLGLLNSERRRWADVRWEFDRGWVRPYLADGWEPGELEQCLTDFADDRASSADWRRFGQLYVEKFNPDEVRRA
jgi:hypothetical protein